MVPWPRLSKIYHMSIIRKDGRIIVEGNPNALYNEDAEFKRVQDIPDKKITKDYMFKVRQTIAEGHHQIYEFVAKDKNFLIIFTKLDNEHVRAHRAHVKPGEEEQTKKLLLMASGLSHMSALKKTPADDIGVFTYLAS